MKNSKKIIICLLCLALVLSMAACGSKQPASSAPEAAPEATPEATPETTPSTEPEQPEQPGNEPQISFPEGTYVSFFSLYMSETPDSFKSMTASDDYMGGAYVEYMGDVKKVGTFDFAVLEDIASALAESGLAALNGTEEYGEGEASASLYAELSDGSFISVGFSGTIAEEFIKGFEIMDTHFADLTAELEEYVPQAQVMGEVDSQLLAAIQEIVNNSGMGGLDTMAISEIALDEYFAFSAGLSSAEHITAGASCAAMMMTTPYSLVIVKLDDAANTEAVRGDFETSMDWLKWVCVVPSHALIAEKDGMVLCLMGSEGLFDLTAASIEAAGWSNISILENPDM